MAEQDIVERLRGLWSTDNHKRGCEGRTYLCDCGFDDRTNMTVREAADKLERLEAENASLRQQLAEARETARREALEEAAKVVDAEAEGRRWQKSDAGAHNDRRAARDFETMMIEAVQIASMIRALSHPDREGERV